MSTVYETCPCGAEWVGPDVYKSEREAFRVAHAVCRSPAVGLTVEEARLLVSLVDAVDLSVDLPGTNELRSAVAKLKRLAVVSEGPDVGGDDGDQ